MLTTLQPILIEVSDIMKEATPDYTAQRQRYAVRAVRRILMMKKVKWSLKEKTLTLSAGTQEYDMTSQATDYSPIRGIYEVWNGDTKLDPVNYDRRANVDEDDQLFYLKPDDKTIGFTKAIDGTESYTVHYYATLTAPSTYTDTLNLAIPEEYIVPIALFTKHLIHEGKRQRYDSRNALLDFKQAMDEIIPQAASSKIKDAPKHVPKLFSYTGFRRTYTI